MLNRKYTLLEVVLNWWKDKDNMVNVVEKIQLKGNLSIIQELPETENVSIK